jgi:hypothetical protein
VTNSWSSAGDVDLSGWLLPGERVHWIGRSARPELPWRRIIPALSLIAVGGALGLTLFLRSSPGSSGEIFAVVVVVFYLGAVVYGAWAAKRDKVANRYVLTDRRAAVFRVPSKLLAQVGVQGSELEVVRKPGDSVGTLRWGESDPVGDRSRWSGGSFSMAVSLLGGNRPERVDFTDVGDVGQLLARATAVRAAWGAPMPDAAAPVRRGPAPGPLGFLDTRGAGVINRVALGVGGIALATAAILLLLTLVGGPPLFGMGPVVPVFVLIFPLFFWAVLMASQGRIQHPGDPFFQGRSRQGRRRQQRFPLEYLPIGLLVAVGVICIAAWISVGLVFASKSLPGQPGYNLATHAYTADDHGELLPLTEVQYDNAVKAQNRLFLSGSVAFLTLAVAMAADETIRRKRSPYVQDGSPPS